MVIQILDHITDEIKQIRIDVFMKEQGFEDEFDEIDDIAKFCPFIYRWQASRYVSLFPKQRRR